MDLEGYWQAVLRQDAEALRGYFCEDAVICWHNSNEQFTRDEFVRANCEYPGDWAGSLERAEPLPGGGFVTAARVCSPQNGLSFHVVSFVQLKGKKIARLDEYWGDDGPPPQWRKELGLGRPIERL